MSKRPGGPQTKHGKSHLPSGLIALGPGSKPSSGGGTGSSSSGAPPPKKQKPMPTTSTTSSSSTGGASKTLFADPVRLSQTSAAPRPSSTEGGPLVEIVPSALVSSLDAAVAEGDRVVALQLVEGAVQMLKDTRGRPDPVLNAALATSVGKHSSLFATPSVVEALVGVLRKEQTLVFKLKANPSVPILAARLLAVVLNKSHNWPESLAKVYVDDALTVRVWVDLEQSKKLVDNINTIFHTTTPPGASSSGEVGQPGRWDVPEINLGEVSTEQRFLSSVESSVRAFALQFINDQLHRTQQADSTSRNLILFLTAAAGWPEMRTITTQRLEGWLQNPKLSRPCQDLLAALVANTTGEDPDDVRVVESLVAVRLRSKILANQYLGCVREVVAAHPDHLEAALKTVIHNELGAARNPGNMQLLVMLITSQKDLAAKVVADVFKGILWQREDSLRSLRSLLRELLRQMKNTFSFPVFARQLMQESTDTAGQATEQAVRERVALAVADLVALSQMLLANMAVRETHNLWLKGDGAVAPQLMEFYRTLGGIQRDAMCWAYRVVQNTYRLQAPEYRACVRKVLFQEPLEMYTGKDNWPPETERSNIIRLMNEACLLEDTLMRVLVIGLTQELPLSPSDALDIADRLVARAASSHSNVLPKLPDVERLEVIDAVLEISMYHAPSSVVFPDDYTPPKLGVSKLYWKGWVLLLVLSAFNPKSLGSVLWKEYPTLRGLMEMVMTRMYDFPPSLTLLKGQDGCPEGQDGQLETKDEAIVRELQTIRLEKEQILDYESYLASASKTKITEKNSLMLNQVTLFDPKGAIRRVPPSVVDLIKNANRSLKLGQLLCACRSPDFLLEIVQHQGASQSMTWLSELVESSEDSLEALPVPCLCEFLLANQMQEGEQEGGVEEAGTSAERLGHREKYRKKKAGRTKLTERLDHLVERLRELVVGADTTSTAAWEVLQYFLEKLSSRSPSRRAAAMKCLESVLSKSPSRVHGLSWLVDIITSLQHAQVLRGQVCRTLVQASAVVMDVVLFQYLLLAIAELTTEEEALETVEALSALLVHRRPLLEKALMDQEDPPAESPPVSTSEVAGALIVMVANALRIAMVTGLPVVRGDPIPENHVAVFRECEDPQGSILLVSLLRFCVLLLSVIEGPALEDVKKEDYEFLFQCVQPADQSVVVMAHDGQPFPLFDYSLRRKILASSNIALLRAVLKDCPVADLVPVVTSFGVPSANVELILFKLDQEATAPGPALKQAVQDPALVCRMVHLQRGRDGVMSGGKFLQYLDHLSADTHPPSSAVTHPPSLADVHSGVSSSVVDALSQPVVKSVEEMETDVQQHSTGLPLEMSDMKSCCKLLKQYFCASSDPKVMNRSLGTKFLSFLNMNVVATELLPEIHLFVDALKKLLKEKEFSRHFCRNTLSPLLTSCLCAVARKHKSLRPTASSVLTSVRDAANKAGNSMLLKAAQHGIKELGVAKDTETQDICKSFKQRLENERRLKLGTVTLAQELQKVMTAHPDQAEGLLRVVSVKAMSSGHSLEAVCTLSHLADGLAGRRKGPQHPSDSYRGLICDWLRILCTEVVSKPESLDVLTDMLFAMQEGEGEGLSGRTLIMSQLVYSSSWEAIHQQLHRLLTEEKSKTLNPTAVMDFIWACLNRPHLWRGVALKEGVVDTLASVGVNPRCLWRVSDDALAALVEYCLREAHSRPLASNDMDLGSLLRSRIPLLYSSCGVSRQKMKTFFSILEGKHSVYPSEVEQLMGLMYLVAPGDLPLQQRTIATPQLTAAGPSVLDAQMHRLILQMTAAEVGTQQSSSSVDVTADRTREAGLVCRKLALQHPTLFLRHLPMLGSLLRGTGSMKGAGPQRGNKGQKAQKEAIVRSCFAVLEQLQPAVFSDPEVNGLNQCLQVYFDLLASQWSGASKGVALVGQFAEFLVAYLQHNQSSAVAAITPHLKAIREYHEMSAVGKRTPMQPVLDAFEGLNVDDGHDQNSETGSTPVPLLVPVQGSSGLTLQKFLPYLKKMSPGQPTEEVLKVLQDLDETSQHSPGIITHFVPDLCRLVASPDPQCCKVAHVLLQRHLKHHPRDMDKLLPVFQNCLTSNNPSVTLSALDSILTILPLCHSEHTLEVLVKLFDLALRGDHGCHDKLLQAVHMETAHMLQ